MPYLTTNDDDDYVDSDTIPVFLDDSLNAHKKLTSVFRYYISNSGLGGILHIIGIRHNFAITPMQAQTLLADYWLGLYNECTRISDYSDNCYTYSVYFSNTVLAELEKHADSLL